MRTLHISVHLLLLSAAVECSQHTQQNKQQTTQTKIAMKKFTRILLATTALQCCSVVPIVNAALSTVVESGEEECFVVRAPPGPENSMIRYVNRSKTLLFVVIAVYCH